MSIPAFTARTIFGYVFSPTPEFKDVDGLSFESIYTFCKVLESEITKNVSFSPDYKYVHFALSNDEIDDYMMKDASFLYFGDKLVLMESASQDFANEIEKKYSDYCGPGDMRVVNALRTARASIREARTVI